MTRNQAILRLARAALAAATTAGTLLMASPAIADTTPGTTPGTTAACAQSSDAAGLQELFASDRAPLHADYQRTIALPDGRVLWTFQDAFVPTRTGGTELVHSAGLVQTGECFQMLHSGTATDPTEWLLPNETTRFQHWWWPMAGAVAADGDVRIFVVEMEERGDHYLDHVVPVATWIVRLRMPDLTVVDARPATDPSPDLYGWSITSDAHWTYLYANCYRQFGFDPFPMSDPPVAIHDLDCSADVRVARVPLGRLEDRPTYWDGSAWSDDPRHAVSVIPTAGRPINPTQVRFVDGRFVAVTKVGDWFGDTIYIDTAPTAHGPFTTQRTIRTDSLCGTECNSYFASPIALTDERPGILTIGLSNNRWDGHESSSYRPTFRTIVLPRERSAEYR